MQTHLKEYQRKLRKNMTYLELALWKRIRHNQLELRFRRQYTYENRIFDFYAPQIKLAIEIDGETHFCDSNARKREIQNDNQLFISGITVFRFSNREVLNNIEGVLRKISEQLKSPIPTFPLEKGEGARRTK